jgi:hypothetical protein
MCGGALCPRGHRWRGQRTSARRRWDGAEVEALGGGTLCPRGRRLHMRRRFAAGIWGGAESTVARDGSGGRLMGTVGRSGSSTPQRGGFGVGRLLGKNWSPPSSEISAGKEVVLIVDHGTAERQTSAPPGCSCIPLKAVLRGRAAHLFLLLPHIVLLP